jgi:RNA-binding protein with serine-rich domain 1
MMESYQVGKSMFIIFFMQAQIDGNVVQARFTLPPRQKLSPPLKAVGNASKRDAPKTENASADGEKDGPKRQRERIPLTLVSWSGALYNFAVFSNSVLILMTSASPRRKPGTSPRRRSPVPRRGGSPRRPPDSPLRRRADSPVRRRVDSPPYRRGDTPPRRRPTSPGRGRSPASPRRNRSPARFTTNNHFAGLMSFLIFIALN